jgi:predicted homoserine dehydrogenase-like protein
MNLQSMLAARIAADKPVRVGLIGAGKFGSMFLAVDRWPRRGSDLLS